MSILRTYNLQNPDSATTNIELTANGGAVATGIVTATGGLNVGAGGTVITTTAGGFVGINSIVPVAELDIVGGASKQLQITGTEADIWLNSIGPGTTWRILGSTGGNTHKFRIYDQTNDVDRFGIDSSGRVTMPYQPYARSSSGTTVSATNAIPLNANNLNRGGITISGNRFTVPVAGAYVIGYHHLGNSGSGVCQIEIRVNNNPIAGSRTQDTNSNNDSFGTQTVAELAANDYVEFWVVQGAAHGNSGYNHMWIWLIG